MSFVFPYQYGFIDNRKIPYPIVTVQLETIRGKRDYSFIVDTGADTLTLPRFMITLLGINRQSLTESKSQGIGKKLVKAASAADGFNGKNSSLKEKEVREKARKFL